MYGKNLVLTRGLFAWMKCSFFLTNGEKKLPLEHMKVSKSAWIIHGFALMHALTALLCRLVGIDDSLILTLMTMLMTVWLCFIRKHSLEVIAAYVILVNVLGFVLGKGGALLLDFISASSLVNPMISTFLTTEILGWSIVLLSNLFRAPEDAGTKTTPIKWLVYVCIVIVAFRFGYMEIFSSLYDEPEAFLEYLMKLFSNVPALLIIICANIILVRGIHKWLEKYVLATKVLITVLAAIIISFVVTLMAGYNFPFKIDREVGIIDLTGIFMITILLQLTVYAIVYLLDYSSRAAKARDEASNKAQLAQFQYLKLKQQISPHFFFNTLNSLDCLVCENENAQASIYIHKLAGIYRYMLSRGEEELVRLREEMTFLDMFTDLIKLRYGTGLEVNTSVGEDSMNFFIVPCSLQLLLENAVKHNVVSEDNPLVVSLVAENGWLTVRNELRPKLSVAESGWHGLRYITEIYRNLFKKEVIIEKTDSEYIVSLPLL